MQTIPTIEKLNSSEKLKARQRERKVLSFENKTPTKG